MGFVEHPTNGTGKVLTFLSKAGSDMHLPWRKNTRVAFEYLKSHIWVIIFARNSQEFSPSMKLKPLSKALS